MLLSIVPLGFLIVLLVISFVLARETDEAAWWFGHSAAVLNASDRVGNTLDQANGAVVRFVMTHQKAALEQYDLALRMLPPRLHILQAMVADNPSQKARAADFAVDATQSMDVLRRFVTYAQAGRMREALALNASPHTRDLSDRVNASKAAFDYAERNLAIERFDFLRRQLAIFTGVVIGLTILGIAATLFVTARFGLRLAQRLAQLADNARRLGEGQDPPRMTGGDEVAELDRVYQDLARRLRRERRVARTLQHALLPARTPVIPGIEITAAYSPATRASDIGGDWYDAFLLTDDLLALSVGDVAGSGLRAATIMGGARQSIRTAARENPDPANVMRAANRMMCADGWLASAFYGVLDIRDGSLAYASAGHPPAIVADGARIRDLTCDGMLLGVDEAAQYSACRTMLSDGNVLVMYTDGLIEAEQDILKGLDRLREMILEPTIQSASSPARAIQQRVFERVRARDDSAILTVRIARPKTGLNGSVSWTFDARDADAARRVRAEMVQFITGHAPETDFSTAELIFSELAGNIARHTPGPARLSIERHNGTIVLRMTDVGDPFLYEHPLEIDPFDESGRGLFLVNALARDMRIERKGSENTVTVLLAS